jgi:hypothetical protein
MTPAELRSVLERAVADANTAELSDVMAALAAAQAKAMAKIATTGAAQAATPAELVDAEALAALLNVPPSQIYEQSRQQRIPCVRLGKYVRFSVAAVLEALASGQGTESPSLGARKKRSNGAPKSGAATALLPIGGHR